MVIPKKAKIGGVVYDVQIVPDWKTRDGCDGEATNTIEMGNTLFIGSDLTPEAQAITFIHEALHQMNTTMNHEFLDSLSEQLYQFLSDNKLLK